jgi:nucleotide-binding universal stress UspA family protein
MPKPILVGYDPREADHAPVKLGIAVARWTEAPLIVACVEVGRSEAVSARPPGVVDADLVADSSGPIELIRTELESAGVPYECRRLASTSAARGLSEAAEAEDAALLVVGSSRRSQTARVLAGSTAFRVLHGAVCPVAVAPRGWSSADASPRTIGVAFVDTDEGRMALHAGHALARRTRATLRVFTVVRITPSMYLEQDADVPAWRLDNKDMTDVEGEHRLDAEENLRRLVASLADDVTVEVDALIGDPGEEIVQMSTELDLLVCGSRGYGPARAVLLGSVSRRVTAEAHCPVVVVPRGVEAPLDALLAEGSASATAA